MEIKHNSIVDVIRDGEKIDEGRVLNIAKTGQDSILYFVSYLLKREGILEFVKNSNDTWRFLYRDPFYSGKKFFQNDNEYRFLIKEEKK